MIDLKGEVFALREDEVVSLRSAAPSMGRWIAIKLVEATLPYGPTQPIRDTKKQPPEQLAIVAAMKNREGLWRWVPLSLNTKEGLGDFLLEENNLETGCWYYLLITDKRRFEANKSRVSTLCYTNPRPKPKTESDVGTPACTTPGPGAK